VPAAPSYLACDGLGAFDEVLDGSGTATAQQLYAPYSTLRYALQQWQRAH
jgi:hypothetical protein